jgi:O-antigen/teichoic acid export membrane protein
MQDADQARTFSGRVVVMFGTQVLVAAVGVINGIFLARLLGPTGKGDYYLLILLPTTMMVVLQLGLPQAFQYFAARGQTVGLIRRSFAFTAGLTALGSLIVLALLPVLLDTILKGLNPELILLGFLSLPLLLLAPLSAAIVIGRQAIRPYAAVYAAQPVTTTILLIALVGILGLGVPGAVAVFVGVAIVNNIGFLLAAVFVARGVPQPTRSRLRELIGYGVRFYPGSLSSFFSYRTDTYLIALLLVNPAEPLGYYTMSVALAEMIFIIPKAVSTVFFPHVAGSAREDADRQVAMVARASLLVCAVAAVLLVPCAIVMIWAILPAFGPSIVPFLILLPGVVALSGANVVGGYVTGIGRPGIDSTVSIIALVVNIVVNILLIPRFGIIGAAATSLFSYTLSSLLLTAVAARFSGEPLWRFWVPTPADARFVLSMSAGLLQRVRTSTRTYLRTRRAAGG